MAPLKQIKYGVPSSNDALTVRFGIEQGIFEAEGLDLSIEIVFGGPDIAAAFHSGEIPIGSLGSPSGIPAMAAGKRFRIIASGCRQKVHLYLGVRKDIQDYHQLKGKRIGLLSIGSCPSWIIHKMLARHGLDANSDVALVPLFDQYPRIIEIMREGGIDACIVTEPNLSIGEDGNILDVWAAGYDEAYLPNFQWIVRVANCDFIEREPEVVAAVLRGCQRSAHHAADHANVFCKFVAAYYDTNVQAVRRAMDREMPLYQLDCQLDLPGLQSAIDMLFELGGIERRMAPADFTDLRFQS
jgi:ABC-type nitrate/sulfonate/bicarbonate transport system substrate-binding protein